MRFTAPVVESPDSSGESVQMAVPPVVAAIAEWPGSELMDDPDLARVLYSVWSGDPAVIVPSPPGAGKTRLVVLLAAALAARAGLRVGIAAQTRQQAIQIGQRLGRIDGVVGRLMWKARTPKPDCGAVEVVSGAKAAWPAKGGAVLIGTTARWLYADPGQLAADVMVVDEAWQATYADVGALGAFARQAVLVGDPGQIAPVVTAATDRWTQSVIGPHRPAPEAISAAHGDSVGVVRLRHTWRLGERTTGLVRPWCYPDLPFTSRRPDEHLNTRSDELIPEVGHQVLTASAGPCDPVLIAAVVARVRQLIGTRHISDTGSTVLTGSDIAVVTAHVNQAAAVQSRLSDEPDVLVGTANSLQGLERTASVVLHPLAGYRSIEPFALDTGRLCVMLSRHRSHTTVICDARTESLLDCSEPGYELMRGVFGALTATPVV